MPITYLKKPGNRRSENNPGGGTAPAAETFSSLREALSEVPKISNKPFINPGVPSMKPTPSVREVLHNQRTAAVSPAQEEQMENQLESAPTLPTLESASPTPTIATPNSMEAPADAVVTVVEKEDFATCWKRLFDELFSNNHLVYHSLKEDVPVYENDIIRVEVKNNIQKDQMEMRKTAILEYWRSHYKMNVDDIEVSVNDQKEEKKVIINSADKMRNMMEQNPQLADFLKVLNLKMKE